MAHINQPSPVVTGKMQTFQAPMVQHPPINRRTVRAVMSNREALANYYARESVRRYFRRLVAESITE